MSPCLSVPSSWGEMVMPRLIGIRKCPRCGREIRGRMSFNGLCADCFLDDMSLEKTLARSLEVKYCPYCGRIKLEHTWKYYSNEELIRYITRKLGKAIEKRLSPHGVGVSQLKASMSLNEFHVTLDVEMEKEGERLDKRLVIPGIVKKEVCPECIKRKIGYHLAVVQVRFVGDEYAGEGEKKIQAILNSLPEKIAQSIVEVDQVRQGLDIKLLNHSSARALASRISHLFTSTMSMSHKLIRDKGGDRITRLTISLKLESGERKWSLGEYMGKTVVYRKTADGKFQVRTLEKNGFTEIILTDVQSKMIRPFRETTRNVSVVSESKEHVFVIDIPEYTNFYKIPKRRVLGTVSRGEEAVLVSSGGEEYLIPKRLLK